MKRQISLRVSPATYLRIKELALRHGTHTEAVAVAIDRLWRSECPARCEECGKPLNDSTPYWIDEGFSVWLCDECAAPEEEEHASSSET